MTAEISVVAPCLNEAGNLRELVNRLQASFRRRNIAAEIILVNDGSQDATREVIAELESRNPDVRGIHHATNLGIPASWSSGVAAAKGTYVCLIDADLQYLPEDVCRLYDEAKHSHFDLVQGYRSSLKRLKDSRYVLSKGLNFLLNLLFPLHLRDAKSGFVIARRPVMEDILGRRYSYRYFQTFITVSAVAKGYRVREIEVLFEDRLVGTSFMSRVPVQVISWCFVDLVKAFCEFRLLRRHSDVVADFLASNRPREHQPVLTGARKMWFDFYLRLAPLHKWIIRRTARIHYDQLQQTQWLTPDQVKRLQEAKLARVVRHAYYHVPYYRRLFDEHAIRPEDIRTLDDLRRIPMLSKESVREHLYDLLSDNHDKKQILKVTTSGSTGEPFVCFADRHQLEIRWAATVRGHEWTGYRFGDRHVRLWHQTIGMTRPQVLREKIDAWLNRRLFIPAFEMSDRTLEGILQRIRAHRPVLVDGYAESFNLLAQYLSARHVDGSGPKAIMSSAQALPDHTRKVIEDTFRCQVFDKYGSREFSGIAYECDAHEGHHVSAESYIVELIKDGRPARPGEIGEVVITDLNNFCMPFLRYRIGDLAEAMDDDVPCRCGRGLPRIGTIQGRVQSIIVGGNGHYIPGTFFAHLFKDYGHVVRQYRIVQHQPGEIDLSVVRASRFSDEIFQEVLRSLKSYLGVNTKIDVEFVDEIPLERTGKRQATVSYAQFDFQTLDRALAAHPERATR